MFELEFFIRQCYYEFFGVYIVLVVFFEFLIFLISGGVIFILIRNKKIERRKGR